jgi:hypothetical protein
LERPEALRGPSFEQRTVANALLLYNHGRKFVARFVPTKIEFRFIEGEFDQPVAAFLYLRRHPQ